MVTMEQIAAKAGVTTATVSNILNGRLKATRSDAAKRAAKVRKIAAEMGYRLNRAASATRTGRTGCIGMLSGNKIDWAVRFDSFDQGLGEALAERNLLLVKDIIDPRSFDRAGYMPRVVSESLAEGIIVNYVFEIPDAIERLIGMHDRPAIWINSKHRHNCIYPDDEGAGYAATRHLLERGHRRIAYAQNGHFVPKAVRHYSITDRQAGYERAMIEAGLQPRVRSLDEAQNLVSDQRSHALRQAHDALAWVGDATALIHNTGSVPLLMALGERGIRVPDDLSLITFENERGTTNMREVTRCTVPFYEMGREAVAVLCDLIKSGKHRVAPTILKYGVIDGPTVRAV
jgi:LacI family transcriptional regulator